MGKRTSSQCDKHKWDWRHTTHILYIAQSKWARPIQVTCQKDQESGQNINSNLPSWDSTQWPLQPAYKHFLHPHQLHLLLQPCSWALQPPSQVVNVGSKGGLWWDMLYEASDGGLNVNETLLGAHYSKISPREPVSWHRKNQSIVGLQEPKHVLLLNSWVNVFISLHWHVNWWF